MTFSIIVTIPETGEMGIAVASRFFACGAMVPYMAKDAIIASQAFINPLWGTEGLKMIEDNKTLNEILENFKQRDQGQHSRQFHAISKKGEIVHHTGSKCVSWAGHVQGKNVSVAGNMLAGPQVVEDTMQAWMDNPDKAIAERLLLAMEAGEDAGGDKRGKQAAGLKISNGQPYPILDLRVDDNADPLSELRRLLHVAEERYTIFRTALPTVENFSGLVDRRPLDEAIAAAEEERSKTGYVSQSLATTNE